TSTGDHPWPATACVIQRDLQAWGTAAVDVAAACSGFTYALAIADGFIGTGAMKRILVVGVDVLTKQVDWKDRSTCILFGDGAGAVVMAPCEPGEGVLASSLGADGRGFEQIWLEGGGNKLPITIEVT